MFFCNPEQFNKALEIMNRAVSGTFVPGIKENMAYFTHAERRIMDSKAAPVMDSRVENEVCVHEDWSDKLYYKLCR